MRFSPVTVSSSPFPSRSHAPRLSIWDPALDWLEERLDERRSRKFYAKRPKRIILVRHGQSEGNTNKDAYTQTPDSQIALTERGYAQASVAGLQIRQLVGEGSVRFFYSPYLRAQQTLLAILQAFDGNTVQISSEPRLREQDFGNFQDADKMDEVLTERKKFGRFYFRFPNGEAGTDVFDRVASFITYLFKSMGDRGYFARDHATVSHEANTAAEPAENYVLVTHGLLMRIFCMCYLRWTVTEFEQVWNPSNCEIWVLQLVPDTEVYEHAGRWRASPYGGSFVDIAYGQNKKEQMPAHMKRPLVSRLVTPGASDALDAVDLKHLRTLPKPKSQTQGIGGRRRRLPSSTVLAYWAKDTSKWEKDLSSNKGS